MYYISNCCGAEITNTDIDICPACGEHCAFELVDEDAALDAQDALNVPNNGDFSAYFDKEQLLDY